GRVPHSPLDWRPLRASHPEATLLPPGPTSDPARSTPAAAGASRATLRSSPPETTIPFVIPRERCAPALTPELMRTEEFPQRDPGFEAPTSAAAEARPRASRTVWRLLPGPVCPRPKPTMSWP